MASTKAVVAGVLVLAGVADGFSLTSMPSLGQKTSAIQALSRSVGNRESHRSGLAGSLTMARKPFIAGNWKMNPVTIDEVEALSAAVVKNAATSPAQVAVFVPHVFLAPTMEKTKGSNVEIGGQNMYTVKKGAFTGAVSGLMLKSVGCKHVLIGHSERRAIFGASDDLINKQVHEALADGLKPLLCIGETKDEYESGLNTMVCAMQLSKSLKGVTKEQMKEVTIAYEPVWAIGTGLVCDAKIAQDVHKYIRSWIAKMYDNETADNIRIQYGGSVTPESVDELMSMPDIDGCLVGGASLDPVKFARIMNYQVSNGIGTDPSSTPFGGKAGGLRDKLWSAVTGVGPASK